MSKVSNRLKRKQLKSKQNPKRVEAGKKGAAARKTKSLANLEKQVEKLEKSKIFKILMK